MEITLEPGQQTGWHTHPVPVFGYILEGELTVDYGAKGVRTYVKGEGLAEAMNEAHNGRNTGLGPVTILAVFIGVEGMPASFVSGRASGAPESAQDSTALAGRTCGRSTSAAAVVSPALPPRIAISASS